MVIMKNRAEEDRKRAQRKYEVEMIMAKHAGDDKKVDMDELRVILTELQGGRPPLPKDLLWCMAEGDKDRSGYLMKGELMIVLHRYKKYVEEQPDVVALIKKHDKNQDMILDNAEMTALLQESTGVDVTPQDVKIVNKYFKEALKESQQDQAGKSIDPDALAKAISRWDDEKNVSEGLFAGMLDGTVPSFNAEKSWTDVTGFLSGLTSCCSSERDDAKSFKRSSRTSANSRKRSTTNAYGPGARMPGTSPIKA